LKLEELATLLNIPELPAYITKTEQLIKDILTVSDSTLHGASLRLVEAGGKRLRPFFVIAAASSQGGYIDDNVIACCAAIELAHIGTLVHDDIIDDAEVRWGISTVNAKEGVSSAILVGDYLLALAAAEAATVSKEVAYLIAATIAEMCDGQSQETSDNYNVDRSIESYRKTIYKKTAALTSAACRLGAICAGLSDKQVMALSKYGEAFGMAFQITDDLLDILSTPEAMGKPVGNDIKEGVYTLPLLLALQGEHRDEVSSWLGEVPRSQPSQKKIVETLRSSGVIDETLKEIRKYNDLAVTSLLDLKENGVVKGLGRLPDAYLGWALKKQTALNHKL
jgi:geranylgeranyl pyrophosphate synthase